MFCLAQDVILVLSSRRSQSQDISPFNLREVLVQLEFSSDLETEDVYRLFQLFDGLGAFF